jgi:hypothetical protein
MTISDYVISNGGIKRKYWIGIDLEWSFPDFLVALYRYLPYITEEDWNSLSRYPLCGPNFEAIACQIQFCSVIYHYYCCYCCYSSQWLHCLAEHSGTLCALRVQGRSPVAHCTAAPLQRDATCYAVVSLADGHSCPLFVSVTHLFADSSRDSHSSLSADPHTHQKQPLINRFPVRKFSCNFASDISAKSFPFPIPPPQPDWDRSFLMDFLEFWFRPPMHQSLTFM